MSSNGPFVPEHLPGHSRRDGMVATAIVILLAAAHTLLHPGVGPFGLDGSFYFQIARNLAEGRGLTTSVSLYYMGYENLPARINIYPLWPLTLGFAGRIMGMIAAANVLPQIFFVIDLALLYLLTVRLERRLASADSSVPYRLFGLRAAHLVVLLLGTCTIYFMSTAMPYTEGMALAFLFASLLAIDAPGALSFRGGLLVGILAGLAYLSRFQMIMAVAAIGFSLVITAVRDRRAWRSVLGAGTGLALIVVPWIAYMSTFIPLSVSALLSAVHPSSKLTLFNQAIATDSLAGWLRERALGLRVAFDPLSRYSFFSSFGPAAALVPLAVIYAVVRLVRRKFVPVLSAKEALLPLAAGSAGFALTSVLLLVHASFLMPWFFGYRHGLPFVVLLAVAIPWLLHCDRALVRGTTAVLVALSVTLGAFQTGLLAAHGFAGHRPTVAEKQLASWLDRQRSVPSVLTIDAQELSVFSRSNFHWIVCDAKPQQTRLMLERLPIDYIVFYGFERDCPYLRDLSDRVRPLYRFGKGAAAIYVLRVFERPAPGREPEDRAPER
ncbi:MAG: hypothetical protein ABI718_07295 [Acidobacteriota bacterium]